MNLIVQCTPFLSRNIRKKELYHGAFWDWNYQPLKVRRNTTEKLENHANKLFPYRFSAFVKIGGENFILGKLGNVKVNEQDVIQVVVSHQILLDDIG